MTEEEVKHLKSDCEYFLNGSDKGEINLHNFIENLRTAYIEPKGKRIVELEAQIEKMKCCVNCKHSRTEYEHCKTDKHEKWEIKEK